ncbi:rRNA-processing protein bfr2 [Gnomoniopsis smithogilvyi]|uniref:Protein BFR2 n=1 Tax=Gnomoniopsis smithogilvyi TaxID=1191159 RepID=A0A9W8YWA2_9PEZI|nr:rRNA-processing protein bfr2 [Gnomoniopsis smithogilvyi]
MAPTTKSRAKRFADFDEKAVKDLDPEADGAVGSVGNGSDSDEDDDGEGTEHYVSVGKSKLRQKEAPALGPKYSGVRVSRAALDDSSGGDLDQEESDDGSGEEGQDSEEFDDPDTADLERDNIIDDEEIDSDEAFEEGEEEIFKKKGFTFKASKSAASTNGSLSKPLANGRPRRAVAADFMSGSEGSASEDDQEDQESELDDESDDADAPLNEPESNGSGSNDDDEGSSAEEDSEDESEEDDENEDEDMGGMDTGDTTADLRKLLKREQADRKDIISGVSQAVKADAEKGVAVRQQRRSYDSLLNLRIRLQKGLVAINSLPETTDDNTTDKKPYEAAEEAAIKLWTAIDSFRTNLLPEPKPGQKRKRNPDASTSNEDLWEDMQATEERASAKRKKILEKWSQKVKATTTNANKQRQLSAAAGSQSLTSVLENQLLNTDRLVKRTHVPRSCAPLQAAQKVAEDVHIYDDADFYQLLLKELVDQRSSDGTNGSAPTVRYTAIKEAKTRKQVDRRASKGRKLRFTVHEKIENFMAPEDRRGWEEDAIDRLFGTLFGQRLGLREDGGSDEEEEVDVAEEGLKLFRS